MTERTTKTLTTAADYRTQAPLIADTEPLRLEMGDDATRYVIRFAVDAESDVTVLAVDAFRTADEAAHLVLALPSPADEERPEEYFRRLFLLDRNRVRLTDAVVKFRRYKAQQQISDRPKRPPVSADTSDDSVQIKKSDGIFQMIISPYKH